MEKLNKFCVVCGGSPDHSHHIFPQHLGGAENSAQVFICGTCHQKIHQCATNIIKGKSNDEPIDWLNRAKPLIDRIVLYTLKAENTDLSKVPSRLIIKLPKEKLRRIHRRKVDLGFSSLEKYIMSLIDCDLPN